MPNQGYQPRNVFIWGKTYPELSNTYLETVCTGGVFEDGSPVRLYPIMQRYLDGEERFVKYQWVTISLQPNDRDQRPESYKVDKHAPIILGDKIGTDSHEWSKRADILFRNPDWIFDNVEDLQVAERKTKQSLGVVTPKSISKISIMPRPADEAISFAEKLDRLKRKNEAERSQLHLFEEAIPPQMRSLDFVSDRIQIEWNCFGASCKGHRMQILDWEVSELLRRKGSAKALEKVRQICNLDEYALKFFLGNLAQHPTAFTIVGLWYPKKVKNPRLF